MNERVHQRGIYRLYLLMPALLICSGCIESAPPQAPPTPPPAQEQPSELIPPPDTTPPTIEIIHIPEAAAAPATLSFEWSGQDNTSSASDLTYAFYLQGYEDKYSQYLDVTGTEYSNIEAGKYIFYVKCRDAAGNVSPVPAEAMVNILPADEGKQNTFPAGINLYPGSDVNSLAMGSYGNVIYTLDASAPALYRSESGPLGWDDLSPNLNAAPSWDELGSAPDDVDFLAVVTASRKDVSLTSDGGQTFYATGLSGILHGGEYIQSIAVSPQYSGNTREIAVGTVDGNGGGRVLMLKTGAFSGSWQDLSTGIPGWQSPTGTGIDVFALKYSPSYASDSALLALGASGPNSTTGNTYLYMGIRDLGGTTINWNSQSSYPVEVSQEGQDTPGTPLICADLALPADFSAASASGRVIFACWSDNPSASSQGTSSFDDVYRLDGSTCTHMNIPEKAICSLAYYGHTHSGKLLAGAMWATSQVNYPSVQVYFTANPASSSAGWQISSKPPTGQRNALVAWSSDGQVAYCGTSGIESALSFSKNDGLTWNQ